MPIWNTSASLEVPNILQNGCTSLPDNAPSLSFSFPDRSEATTLERRSGWCRTHRHCGVGTNKTRTLCQNPVAAAAVAMTSRHPRPVYAPPGRGRAAAQHPTGAPLIASAHARGAPTGGACHPRRRTGTRSSTSLAAAAHGGSGRCFTGQWREHLDWRMRAAALSGQACAAAAPPGKAEAGWRPPPAGPVRCSPQTRAPTAAVDGHDRHWPHACAVKAPHVPHWAPAAAAAAPVGGGRPSATRTTAALATARAGIARRMTPAPGAWCTATRRGKRRASTTTPGRHPVVGGATAAVRGAVTPSATTGWPVRSAAAPPRAWRRPERSVDGSATARRCRMQTAGRRAVAARRLWTCARRRRAAPDGDAADHRRQQVSPAVARLVKKTPQDGYGEDSRSCGRPLGVAGPRRGHDAAADAVGGPRWGASAERHLHATHTLRGRSRKMSIGNTRHERALRGA